jgi:sulfite reductase (NADPH) flavoprotein alpha-component
MLSQAEDLFDWLEEGAHVYVCGDATRMAKDVDEALRTVIEKHVGNPDAAAEYMARLKREKRYVRDVY